MRTKNGGVRGLGVRGLGERQYKARLMTQYKIVSFLAVCPFTFEQLWRVSRIQRNVLRKNLDLLVEEGSVLAHRYSIPYTREFYGYMYKYPVPYMTPTNGRKYYLLDCSQRQCDAYMNFYYNNMAKERKEPFEELLIKERQKRKHKLCMHEDEAISFKTISKLEAEGMTQTELRDHLQMSEENLIYLERLIREDEIIAVKFGERFQNDEETITNEELDRVTKVSDFFTKRRYSSLDVLVRCSTEHTRIHTSGYYADDLNLGLIRYNSLWKIMDKAGLLRNLI